MHHEYRILSKQHDRLKKKIAAAAEQVSIVVDEEIHADLMTITSEGTKFVEEQPPDSFQRIFWQQQLQAAAQKDARTMRWHPLMIRWCLHLRHRLVL